MTESNFEKKIFCIGLSRTGTTTFHQLMQDLGFRSTHTAWSLFSNNNVGIFEKFDAFSDSPIPMMYPKCYELFPEAKFFLTTRDKKKWLDSMKWMFKHGRVIGKWWSTVDNYHELFYGTKVYHEKILSKHWDDFHREVSIFFSNKKNQLLVLDLENGIDLKQLSEFLDIPHNNDIIVKWANKRRKANLKERLKYHIKRMARFVIHNFRK